MKKRGLVLNKTGGFTLIEILVVIAIIGVLASIILVSLNTTTKKANNAKVKAQLEQIRNAAQIYFTTNLNYSKAGSNGNTCNQGIVSVNADNMFDDNVSNMDQLVDEANYPSNTTVSCRTNVTAILDADEYAVSATLAGGPGGASVSADNWCVDSAGFSGAIADPLNDGDTTCQ